MKKINSIPGVSLLLLLSMSACIKDVGKPGITPPEDIIDTAQGKFSFKVNGTDEEKFHATGQKINNKIVIGGYKLKPLDGMLITYQGFEICIAQKSLARQRIFKRIYDNKAYSDSTNTWANLVTMDDDGDAGCENFTVVESDSLNNYIQITRQAGDFSEVWGIFNLSFKKTQSCKYGFYPDDVKITNGYFHAFIK